MIVMAEWRLFFTNEATEDFRELDDATRVRVGDKLEWLRGNFNNITPASLGGRWRGYFKLRVGDWRVIYKVDWIKNAVIVCVVGPRDKVYKT